MFHSVTHFQVYKVFFLHTVLFTSAQNCLIFGACFTNIIYVSAVYMHNFYSNILIWAKCFWKWKQLRWPKKTLQFFSHIFSQNSTYQLWTAQSHCEFSLSYFSPRRGFPKLLTNFFFGSEQIWGTPFHLSGGFLLLQILVQWYLRLCQWWTESGSEDPHRHQQKLIYQGITLFWQPCYSDTIITTIVIITLVIGIHNT